jgi:ribosomal protein S20
VAAAAFLVEAKQNSLKRQRTSEKSRMYNKSRKSEIATRMKKVGAAAEAPGGRWLVSRWSAATAAADITCMVSPTQQKLQQGGRMRQLA